MSFKQPNEFAGTLARGVELYRGNVQGFPPRALACRHGLEMRDAAPGKTRWVRKVLERLRELEFGKRAE